MISRWGARLAGLAAALALTGLAAPAALAQQDQGSGGQSTPGVTVTAQNPGPGSVLRITLTAHTNQSAVTDPSCRPQDATLNCTASLVLRDPAARGLSVTGFQVHMVAVGTTSCGGEGENCGGEGGDMTATATGPVNATVHGLATLTDPGSTGMTQGITVQVFIDLVDNGTAQYEDQVQVLIRPFVEGSVKPPWVYDPGWQTIQQVQIHELGAGN